MKHSLCCSIRSSCFTHLSPAQRHLHRPQTSSCLKRPKSLKQWLTSLQQRTGHSSFSACCNWYRLALENLWSEELGLYPLQQHGYCTVWTRCSKAKGLWGGVVFDYFKKICICYYYDDQATVNAMDLVCQTLAEASIMTENFLWGIWKLPTHPAIVSFRTTLHCAILSWNTSVFLKKHSVQRKNVLSPLTTPVFRYTPEVFNAPIDKYAATTDDASVKRVVCKSYAAAMECMAITSIYGFNTVFI